MSVVIAGGHGKIGLRLARLLAGQERRPVGLVRKPEHEADLIAVGAHPVRFDLESGSAQELAEHLRGAQAVVFAAGAGPGSGVARKDTVDRAAAALLADAAEIAGVRRYLMISAIGVDEAAEQDFGPDQDQWAAYVRAKKAADDDLRSRDLDWTVLRPGRLTDASGTGEVALGSDVGRGDVPREDVAAVLVALLDEPRTIGLTVDLVAGSTPIAEAVAALAPSTEPTD
ncbi:NAD-dependent epimerase/dehydratase family protein [Nakamurella flava]|uniref:NAD-dependent epimerase/dehydratase family protein n=1 Tax=Nakamurella flava TaxID=2576308 RepID=A0A4U6QE97_9ACTN|nr:NAD(P)H-binding protein [Nakamurella flava]TKV58279.1 NAD-dependent epimerase/dehydratase family protein [Nakamurella flava]